MEIFRCAHSAVMFFRRMVEQHFLLGFQEVKNIRQGPLSRAVPNHKPTTRVLSHREVLDAVIVAIMRETGLGFLLMGGPLPDVVSAHVHTINHHMLVAALGKVPLHRLVRAVRVPYKHLEILLNDVIEALLDLRIASMAGGRPSIR
jgi:hypothetical protein